MIILCSYELIKAIKMYLPFTNSDFSFLILLC